MASPEHDINDGTWPYIIVVNGGNMTVEGFVYVGPFATSDDAYAYAETGKLGCDDWWVSSLVPPP